MHRIIDNPLRYAQTILESWLDEDNDGFWLTGKEAVGLVRKAFPELNKAELARVLASEDGLSGSTLERCDFDGMERYRLNPKIKRSYG